MGVRFLNEAVRARGSEKATCQYNGQTTQLKELGWCWAQEEYKHMVSIIENPGIAEIDADKNSPTYAQATYMDGSGAVIGKTLNCQDHTDTLAKALAKMADNYKVFTSDVREQTYYTSLREDFGRRRNPLPSVRDVWCINDIMVYMDVARALVDGIGVYEAFFVYVTSQILDKVCEYVMDTISTTIENFLSNICLPLPDLSYSLSLDTVKRKTCSGMTLSRAMAVNGGMLTQEDIRNGLDRLLSESGIPAINSLPSLTWQSPSIAGPLRAIFGSTSTGQTR
jgi:hypothetical protein